MIELQVLNRLISSGDAGLILMNNIDESFFPDYKDEFQYIKTFLNQYGKVPDIYTFLTKFPDFDVIEVNETNDYLIDALFEDKNKRFLANTFNKMRTLLMNGNVEEAMNLYVSNVDTAVRAKHIDSVDIFRDTSRYNDYIDKGEDFAKFYIKTGFKELDELIGGWDRNEELATIVARTNQGKSWLLLKVAIAAAEQGLRVGLYSGEMSENKVGYRADTLISHISNFGLLRGNRDLQNEYKKYIDELPNRFSGCLKVLTPKMIDGPAGVTALRSFIEKEKLDMLCIDQHSLLEDDHHARNPVERAANISKDLKNLQTLKKIPIISVSQQNRGSTENGVNTTLIAQSDRIGQDSTIVIFFEQKDKIMTMYLVKSRDSSNNKNIKYALDLDKGIFQYLPSEDNAVNGAGVQELREEFEEEEKPF